MKNELDILQEHLDGGEENIDLLAILASEHQHDALRMIREAAYKLRPNKII